MYRLDREKRNLFFGGQKIEPRSVEETVVGFCSFCDGELFSLACYKVPEGWLVASRCNGCERQVLSRYDPFWSWEEDLDFEVVESERSAKEDPKITSLSEIPREELEAVFTPAELRDMERCEKGEAYTRQNLYRARAKYEKFERLFGVRIDI